MKLRNIKDPSIAKEKYKFNSNIKTKISKERWIEFIEHNAEYFTWLEDTDEGKETLANLDMVPASFREGLLKGHNKSRAFAEFNSKKGYYEIYVDFVEPYGKISTTFQKKITKEHLRLLLDMANHLDAYLLNNGNKVIDQTFLDSLE